MTIIPRIAHLLLVHKSPQQVARLVKRLASNPAASVFIHVDAKSDVLPFMQALSGIKRVHFIRKRIAVNWGGFSMVKAMLYLLQTAFKSDNFDFFNLLSGEDYPLKPTTEIHHFLNEYKGKSFVEFQQQGEPWWEHAQKRFTRYYFTDFHLPGKHTIERVANFILPSRKRVKNITLVGRSQWMTLHRNHVDYIIKHAALSGEMVRFFQYSWAPDEFFFQSLLFNSPHRADLINDNLRYIVWKAEKASPETLTVIDLPALKQSNKLFARKFDQYRYPEILNELDKSLVTSDLL